MTLSSEHCTFTFERLRPGAILVRISGYDRGDFGTAPLDELVAEIGRNAPLELFIDASDARGAAWDVSMQWTSWFREYQDSLARVDILVDSKLVQQTILVAKELSRTLNLLSVYTNAETFAALVQVRTPERASTAL
jgi:hypothetical protein